VSQIHDFDNLIAST